MPCFSGLILISPMCVHLCFQAVVTTNKFEKDMATRFGGGAADVSTLRYLLRTCFPTCTIL